MYSVCAGILTQIIQFLLHQGIDTEHFLDSVGLNNQLLKDPDARIPIEKYIEVEEKAALILNDECFGIHLGQFTEVGNWTILGYMMMNCKSILEACKKFERYSNIIGNLIRGEISEYPNEIIITLAEPKDSPIISRHCYQGYFSSIVCLARSLTGENILPIETGFISGPTGCIDEYKKVFGPKVLFGQEKNYIIFNRMDADKQVLLPNGRLLQYFENYAMEFLKEIDCKNSFTIKTKKLILSYLDLEDLSIKKVAKELAVSPRALQTNLKVEGTDFRKILQETRESLAKKYLQDDYSVEDITYLLGFSEPSVFRKAFRNWTGITPKEFRRNLS